jgi:hypothetical protein
VPYNDGWANGFFYAVRANGNDYAILSNGRDKLVSGVVCGTTTDFNMDIIYSDGTFLQWPEGTQN